MFLCEVCSYSSKSIKSYVLHYRLHRNHHNIEFPCGYRECSRRFKKYSAFRSHLQRDHVSKNPDKAFANVSLKCNLQFCKHLTFDNIALFISHIKFHISDGIKIRCPYDDCCVYFEKKSSFTSHISRYHKHSSLDKISAFHKSPSANRITNEICPTSSASSVFNDNMSDVEGMVEMDHLYTNMALFYLKLHAKHFVSNSVIQDINEQFFEINKELSYISSNNLRKALKSVSIDDKIIEKALSEFNNSGMEQLSSMFETDYKRSQYFKKNFNFIEPTEVFLGKNNLRKDCYIQYVSIISTLQTLLKNQDISEQFREYEQRKNKVGQLEDVMDGAVYKQNSLFKNCPNSLAIILFQDAFEVVNPLGSAKKKHKVIGVYFTLLNFHPSYRSNIDNIQLLILCREVDLKYFGQEKVFSPLINDLKLLESSGINVNRINIKGTVCAIVGDNLGSHIIGGFQESFNCEYFCRYCLLTQNEFKQNPYAVGEIRSPVSYDSTVISLSNNAPLEGIKFESLFNQLNYFHVCQPGLPPCLGHDLFEGVVAYDLALYIKHFVKVKLWFTYEYFNHIIATFNYTGMDSRNKPNPINIKGEKITGHAAQNWCLLRLLPVLISHKIQDKNDNIWNLCLNLRTITEFICAPKINLEQVAYLQVLIDEYVELRHQFFPNTLKPKHHFLCHYPSLIYQFGPLIRLWTLRFESKHSYFKKCARHACNFKNICLTLALRHQMLQAYIHAGKSFKSKIIINKSINFYVSMFSADIQNSLPPEMTPFNSVVSHNVVYQGITYQKDNFLPLEKNTDGILFGKIQLIIIKNNHDVYFIVEQIQSVFLYEYGVHALLPNVLKFCCVHINNLLDYYPLSTYLMDKYCCICLHHACE